MTQKYKHDTIQKYIHETTQKYMHDPTQNSYFTNRSISKYFYFIKLPKIGNNLQQKRPKLNNLQQKKGQTKQKQSEF